MGCIQYMLPHDQYLHHEDFSYGMQEVATQQPSKGFVKGKCMKINTDPCTALFFNITAEYSTGLAVHKSC